MLPWLHICVLPAVAAFSLTTLAFASPAALPKAQWQFFATLAFAIAASTVTVARCDDCWLIHTGTVAALVLGALVLPQRSTTINICPLRSTQHSDQMPSIGAIAIS